MDLVPEEKSLLYSFRLHDELIQLEPCLIGEYGELLKLLVSRLTILPQLTDT
jgi:hypothetical protein